MKNTLLVSPACFKNNDEKMVLLKELQKSLDARKEIFWQDESNTIELKQLLIEKSFDRVIICFFDLIESDIPEFQVIKSLALKSRIILFYPNLKLIKQQKLDDLDLESEIIKWKLSGRNALLNIFAQSDLVVVANDEEAALLAETDKAIKTIKKQEYLHGDHEFGTRASEKVSIIMLTYNQLEDTKSCVESLIRHTSPGYELIFVDNGSTDATVDYLESLKTQENNIKIIINKTNLGFSKANNQGMRIATGDYILLLNNDVILTAEWLERLLACAESDPSIGVVGPCTNKAVGEQVVDLQVEYNDQSISKIASLQEIRNAGCWFEVHRIIGFCMLIKREVIARIGMLDEQFGPGGFEDYDYCLRVNQAGYKIMIASDVFIYHIGGRGYTGNNLDYDKLRQHNVQLFIEKWCRRALEVLEAL